MDDQDVLPDVSHEQRLITIAKTAGPAQRAWDEDLAFGIEREGSVPVGAEHDRGGDGGIEPD